VTAPRLLITADDYGLTEATCRAIVDAHRSGVVTGTSVLAVAPRLERHLLLLDDAPRLEVGAHLALVGEDPPILSAKEVPSLVDRRGRFPRSWRQLAPRVLAGRVDPADVRRELEAQVERIASGLGRPLDHVDAHQHVHLLPPLAEIVVDLAVRHEVPRVRVPRSAGRGARAATIERWADALAASIAGRGRWCTERFRGLDEAGGWSTSSLAAAIDEVGSDGRSTEINLHPGADQDPHRARYAWGYAWGAELAAATSAEVASAIGRSGLPLGAP
jgi:predicted glycoside hydrolase/deacetylase ChbG (UPF0249 family)